MPECPTCHQAVDPQAIACPYCRTTLKAYGHPGIPLYRATGETSLCDTCLYDADDTCNFPQRPYAKECTLYCDRTAPRPTTTYKPTLGTQIRFWFKRYRAWIVLAGIGLVSFVWVLQSR